MKTNQFAPPGLSPDAATAITEALQRRLASLIDLSLTLKHVHWNVVGPGFMSLHKLMDEQAAAVSTLVDEMAERITTLGGVAAGLPDLISRYRSSDEDYALGRAPATAHLGALEKAYAGVIGGHRESLDQIERLDPVSGDVLVGQIRVLELNQWFIRAHLADIDGELSTAGASDEVDAALDALEATGEVLAADKASATA
ncbi:MAG: DNA starvation/stationary phase protection protein [Acidimicrobiia bacterium]|nr:DNA starvation/stationary phase protection protein [Acidimicrobiia bacterium]